MSKMIKATKPNDIPSKPHFAIIRFKTRSFMSKGYDNEPDYSDSIAYHEYSYTLDRQTWIEEIQAIEKANSNGSRYAEKDTYAAIEVASKASIQINVIVGVK